MNVCVYTMLKNVELRKLPAGSLYSIVDILETNEDWKRVIAIIPKEYPLSGVFAPKYNNEHVRLIEEASKASGKKCAEILFEEWGTSGRVRPTLTTLKDIVLKAGIYRAADEIALMMQEAPPVRPDEGPAAPIDTDITTILNNESIEQRLKNMDPVKYHYLNSDGDNKVTRRIGDNISNQTTAQMKSASNLIHFTTTDVNTSDIPKLSALQSYSDNTTAQIKSESAMIKFSSMSVHDKNLESEGVPNLDVVSADDINQTSTASSIPTESQSSVSSYSSQIPQDTEPISSTSVYQMSVPNLDFQESLESRIDSSILLNTKLVHFEYKLLEEITNNFSPKLSIGPNGLMGHIGSGGFGEVFAGFHSKYGLLAIKKAHNHFFIDRKPDIAIKVFNSEVKHLSQFRHNNIVPILGFSKDGPALCIICEYIEGGSLEQRIAAKVLTERQRIDIMVGIAEGLKYLHTSEKEPDNEYRTDTESQTSKKSNFLHGDVKSANVLLTRDCVPKLCDFGLAKQFDTTFITTSPMGTSAYMAPEGFSGTITQKIDIYSFGVVMLELLTGLRPIIVNSSEKINIRDFIEENIINNDISKLLDPVVDYWKKPSEIYELSKRCLETQRKNRPAIEDICDSLYKINDTFTRV